MIPKVVYNPEIRTGQLHYIEGDTLLTFDYDFYKPAILINIPLHYDDHPDPESAEQMRLHFIGTEVARRQPLPCQYRITRTSIIVSRASAISRVQRWQLSMAAGIMLLGVAAYRFYTGAEEPFGRAILSPPGKHPSLSTQYPITFAGLLFFAFGYFPWRNWRRSQSRLKHFLLHHDD